MLEVCSGVTNGREKDGGGTRGPIRLWSEGPRVMGDPLCAMCSSVCSRFEPGGYLLGESAPLFIDEGDGLTSERERVYVC